MARRVLLLVNSLLMLLGLSCRQTQPVEHMPVYAAHSLALNWRNGVAMQNNEPFTGIVYALQPGGRDTAEIACFKLGKEHGVWKKFYPGGKLMEVRHFADGRKEGKLTAWWPDGRPKLAYHFKNGEYSGLCREWLPNGVLIAAMTYKDGHEEGRQQQFYNDGKVKANYLMVNGRRYGLLGTKNCVNVTDSIFKK